LTDINSVIVSFYEQGEYERSAGGYQDSRIKLTRISMHEGSNDEADKDLISDIYGKDFVGF